MNLNTTQCTSIQTETERIASSLRSFYEGLNWSDDVYASFDLFVCEVEQALKEISHLAGEAAQIASGLSSVDTDALIQRFAAVCEGDD
ncbi:MAG: hypothetical protein IKW24_05565 [Clostridia bacterium]|nr:hypothetical protein [Clostridia bacterium]